MKGQIFASQLRDRDVVVDTFEAAGEKPKTEYALVIAVRHTDHETICELRNGNGMRWQRTYNREDVVELA